jgi:hypothetical protein
VTGSWVWRRADVVARRSALPVQVLPLLVGGVCGDDGAHLLRRCGAGPRGAGRGDDRHGALCRRCVRTVDRDVEVVRGPRDQWRSLARSSEGVSVPRMRVVVLLATVFLTGLLGGAWLC